MSLDDEIDAVDAVDAELFPIFDEEAQELMPRLGAALRRWSDQPDDVPVRLDILRVLHTLKGSARLAGALRLGEMAHRMESVIQAQGEAVAPAEMLDALVARFDTMQASLAALRAPAPELVEKMEEGSVEASLSVPPPPAESAGEAPVMAPQTPVVAPAAIARPASASTLRVRTQLLDRVVNQSGEVMITRSRLEGRMGLLRSSLDELTGNLDRLRHQLRDIELQAESQMQSRLAQAKDTASGFDPLEFDRFTRVQELTRMMAESVNDVATVQRNLQRTVLAAEDDLAAQARQASDLQRDLLRTRMVEFESVAERLYAIVRQAAKETGKQIKLDIVGGSIEMDRSVLDRMVPAFEHLLRNAVVHGIEAPARRVQAAKPQVGTVEIRVSQQGNDVAVEFRDDGAGFDLGRIRDKAVACGLIAPGQPLSDQEVAQLVFAPGVTTTDEVTELAGRGIGLDAVRSEVNAVGGRLETSTQAGQGSVFRMVLPLTTAVTQVVMLRCGGLRFGVPAGLVEIVHRAAHDHVDEAYRTGAFVHQGQSLGFYWGGALLQNSPGSTEPVSKHRPVVIIRSADQRLALHVDEVQGNQEVVVKNLGPQLSRLPGLAGMSVLASGDVVLIYNPVALAVVYGEQARAAQKPPMLDLGVGAQPQPSHPLVLVVDDSITVRRVTQRLLLREGYRVALAVDGVQAIERLSDERPALVLTDIEMPRMDGFDLLRHIRGQVTLQDLPVIMITSRIASKHRELAMTLGVNHYLGKPYAEDELLALIRHYTADMAQAH